MMEEDNIFEKKDIEVIESRSVTCNYW